jgi:putative peptidoglycan lipid II flippase
VEATTHPVPPGAPVAHPRDGTGPHAFLVAAGILLSRVVGLLRQSVFAHFFSTSAAADAFNAAFRIPNLLQNLFGEGALSASFIPVYARLLARGEREEAGRVAGAVIAILALVTSIVVLLGVLFTPWIIAVIAQGFTGAKRALTIQLVRILFPGAGIFVLSAWCLGILNSHRRFFLSYAAPVLWNVAMIAALLGFGPRLGQADLAVALAWASVAGAALQFLAQLPSVLALVTALRVRLDADPEVRLVMTNFGPVFVSRGVVQLSAFIDQWLASWLPTGAVAALVGYAGPIAVLPVSLFGMAVSAAELPAMAGIAGARDVAATALRDRLERGLRRIAYFVVPSAVAFVALGDVVASTIYQSGRFTRDDAVYVWGILAGAAVGLLATTLGRLYSSTYYALHDTRTPLRYALVRVALTTALGYLFAILLPPLLGIAAKWGAAGLTASAGIAGWVEFLLLRRALNRRIGRTGLPIGFTASLWGVAVLAASLAFAIKLFVGPAEPRLAGLAVLGTYGVVYLGVTSLAGLGDTRQLLSRLAGRRGGG